MSLGGLSLQGLIHGGAYFRKFTVLVNGLGSNFFLCWFFYWLNSTSLNNCLL